MATSIMAHATRDEQFIVVNTSALSDSYPETAVVSINIDGVDIALFLNAGNLGELAASINAHLATLEVSA